MLSAQPNNEKLFSLVSQGNLHVYPIHSLATQLSRKKRGVRIPPLRDGSSGLRTLLSNGTKTSEQRGTWGENSWVGRQSQFENSISSREKQGKHKQNESRAKPRGAFPQRRSASYSQHLNSFTPPTTESSPPQFRPWPRCPPFALT